MKKLLIAFAVLMGFASCTSGTCGSDCSCNDSVEVSTDSVMADSVVTDTVDSIR